MNRLLPFICGFLICCQGPVSNENKEASPGSPTFEEALEIETEAGQAPLIHEKVDADLFGKFYSDRTSFYTKENPGLQIQGVDVDRVVFYYVDEELLQTRYEMSRDITPELIKTHGKFKIRGLNSRNDYFIKRLRSKILSGNNIVSLINFYQLRWEDDEGEILYQVRRDTVETFYTCIERVKGYKQILKRVAATSD